MADVESRMEARLSKMMKDDPNKKVPKPSSTSGLPVDGKPVARTSASPEAAPKKVADSTARKDEKPSAMAKSMERSFGAPRAEDAPGSPTSPNSPNSKEKQEQFRFEKVEFDLRLAKDKIDSLEEEKKQLKKQVEDGLKRREQMKKIEQMMPEFRRQIDEARAENETLHAQNEELTEEVEELKRQLAAQKSGDGGKTVTFSQEDKESMAKEAAEARAALDNETRKAAQVVDAYQKKLAELNAKSKSDADEIAALKAALGALNEKYDKAMRKIASLKETVESMKTDLSGPIEPPNLMARPETKQMVEKLEEEVRSLKAGLAAKNKYIREYLKNN